MVEVVTLEEFNELRKSIEERLDSIERKIDDLIKNVNERHLHTQEEVDEAMKVINRRIDDLEDSSKGFVDRLREAIRPRSSESSPPQEETHSVGGTEKTLGRVADVIIRCPNFFDWDWCQENCPMYLLCDGIAATQDVSKLSKKETMERIKGLLKYIESLRSRPRKEGPGIAD